MHKGLVGLGFEEKNIQVAWEPTHDEMNDYINDIYKDIRLAEKKSEAVFIFLYFSGHGEAEDK